jgi:hypothetical protein
MGTSPNGSFFSLTVLRDGKDFEYLIGPTNYDVNGEKTITYFSGEEMLWPIRSAIHYAAHDVLSDSPIEHDDKIKLFIRDFTNNLELNSDAYNELLLLIEEMKMDQAKTDMLLELAPFIRESSSHSLQQLYSKVALVLPDDVEQKTLAGIFTILQIPYTFDPKQLGISDLLENPYQLRLEVQDNQGQRDAFNETVPAGQTIRVPLTLYGEAYIQIFVNDILFMASTF